MIRKNIDKDRELINGQDAIVKNIIFDIDIRSNERRR